MIVNKCPPFKMIFLLCIFFCAIAAHPAKDVKKTNAETEKCEGIQVNGKFHKKVVLGKGLNRPYQLAIYKPEHKVFFSNNVGKDEEDTFEIAYLQKDHVGHKVINSVVNGFATAVDEEHHEVFFGGSQGIYKYEIKKNESEIQKVVSDHNVWDMFFKKELYFVDYPSQKLYKYNTSKSHEKPKHEKHIFEKIYQFVIDGDGDIFITNETGLFMIKNGTDKRIFFENGPKVFRAIEINNKGVAHFCGEHGIFVTEKKKRTLKEIAHIKNIFGLTFDSNDNIIYSDPHEIVKLLPEECKK